MHVLQINCRFCHSNINFEPFARREISPRWEAKLKVTLSQQSVMIESLSNLFDKNTERKGKIEIQKKRTKKQHDFMLKV
jgi:hypothetical protein